MDGNGGSGRWWRRPRQWWLLGIPPAGFLLFIAGIAFWGAFNAAVALSNTETFCISCHEMRDTVYVEYRDTIHDRNRTGVRATCPDCHVPDAWGPKMVRKVQATFKELPNHFLGKIDTPEKFEAHRAEMAQHVWDGMKATNSRECRNCHAMDHMDLERQDRSARKRHGQVLSGERDATCIDCHQGIAHRLPEVAGTAPPG